MIGTRSLKVALPQKSPKPLSTIPQRLPFGKLRAGSGQEGGDVYI